MDPSAHSVVNHTRHTQPPHQRLDQGRWWPSSRPRAGAWQPAADRRPPSRIESQTNTTTTAAQRELAATQQNARLGSPKQVPAVSAQPQVQPIKPYITTFSWWGPLWPFRMPHTPSSKIESGAHVTLYSAGKYNFHVCGRQLHEGNIGA
jgi:hypothetical protein